MQIPSILLRKLYTAGSLRNTGAGAQFALKNRLSDAELVGLSSIAIDGTLLAMDQVRLELDDHRLLTPSELNPAHPLPFPVRSTLTVQTGTPELGSGPHEIEISFDSRPFGNLLVKFEDAISDGARDIMHIPRDEQDDYSPETIQRRRALVEEVSGVKLHHLAQHSFDPHLVKGNCENFIGVAQVPIGLAGPLHVDGEYAERRLSSFPWPLRKGR